MRFVGTLARLSLVLLVVVIPGRSEAESNTTVLAVASEICGSGAETLVTASSGACESRDLLFRLAILPAGTADPLYVPLTATHQRKKLRSFVGSCFFPLDYANQTAGGLEYQGFASNQAFAQPKAPEKAVWAIYVSFSARGRSKTVRPDLERFLADFDQRVRKLKLGAIDAAGNSYCQKSSP